jgi:hypothetical protein
MDLSLKYLSYDPNYNYDDNQNASSNPSDIDLNDENSMEQDDADENGTDEKY